MLVNNQDILSLVRMARRFKMEIIKSTSSNLNHLLTDDYDRNIDYVTAMSNKLDWVVAQPQLDLPESNPTEFDAGPEPSATAAENDMIVDLSHLYDNFMFELANSASARMGSGMISHDERRARRILAKMQSFLTDYVSVTTPHDTPETTPMFANTGKGNTGINP